MSQSIILFLSNILLIFLLFKANGLTFKMVSIDSLHSQILPQHLTHQQRHQFLTNISRSRLHSYTKNPRLTRNSLVAPLTQAFGGYYTIPITLGTGDGNLTTFLYIDTAASQTWLQCNGCNPCTDPNPREFLYMVSPSYKKMRANDPMCDSQLVYQQDSCGLDVTTNGNGPVIGFFGRDTFSFQSGDSGDVFQFPSIAFGCVPSNGTSQPYNQLADDTGVGRHVIGKYGLAPGRRSFLTQLDKEMGGRFSYCLVSWELTSHVSYINFGDDVSIGGDDANQIQTISMYKEKYHLYLSGISVDGTKLPVDPSVFELDEEKFTKGFFIDSGAPYTLLTRSAYVPLKEAMINYFRGSYGWEPIAAGKDDDEDDFCYSNNLNEDQDQKFPSVILHFRNEKEEEEIDWVMEDDNLFFKKENNEGFCLGIYVVDDPGPSIFGAFQQVNFDILYDVNDGFLSFVRKKCDVLE